MAPPILKEFEKDVTDMLTKEFAVEAGKEFKLEGKLKGADKTIYANPIYEAKSLGCSLQYDDKANCIKSKLTVGDDLKLKEKLTFDATERCGHKLDVTVKSAFGKWLNWGAEVNEEYKGHGVVATANVKTGATDPLVAEFGVASDMPCFIKPNDARCGFGVGVTYAGASGALENLTVALRWAAKATLGTVRFNAPDPTNVAAHSLNFGVLHNFEVAGHSASVAGQWSCCGGAPLVGASVQLCPSTTLKARLDGSQVLCASVTKKFSGNFTASFSVNDANGAKPRFGMNLTQE